MATRTKHYGRQNKGFSKAAINRTKNAITRRIRNGETAETSKAFAQLLDNAFGGDRVEQYHGK